MKRKDLLYFSFFLFLFSCAKSEKNTQPTPEQKPVTQVQSYSLIENFEAGTKAAYASGNVRLMTGTWIFEDALLGNLASDSKNGANAVRLRSGRIAMTFDVSGVETVHVNHAKYGSDGDSQWELWMSDDAGTTFTKVGGTVNTNSTTLVADSFKVAAKGKVRFEIRKIGTTRLNIDDITIKGKGDPGIIVGEPDTGTDSGETSGPDEGRGTPDGTGPDVPPARGDNSNMLLGNPSGAQSNILFPDNYLIDQKYYVQSYSNNRGTPNWVSWHLDATSILKATDRLDNFAAFTGLPAGWYQVQNDSYKNSGFDRGHNCPSADRVSSAEANSSTFLMSNMIPQAPENNQKTWANLENYLRGQVVLGNEVYIIMGSYGSGGTGRNGAATGIDHGRITVPAYLWKVAVILPSGSNDLSRISATTRVIAIQTPNNNSTDPDWKKYVTTIREIEKATHYNLLSELPARTQDVLETTADGQN